MILTDYYRLEQKQPPTKSNRYDCTASTGGYKPFDDIAKNARGGAFFCYLNKTPKTFSTDAQRNAGMAITNQNNISSVFIPDPKSEPYKGFGDTKGTQDALLFLFGDEFKTMEIFVARGQKFNAQNLYQIFVDGEFDYEMEVLRNSANARQ